MVSIYKTDKVASMFPKSDLIEDPVDEIRPIDNKSNNKTREALQSDKAESGHIQIKSETKSDENLTFARKYSERLTEKYKKDINKLKEQLSS